MTRARWLALAVVALLITAGTVKQLTATGLRETGSNRLSAQQFLGAVRARAGICQALETLRAGTKSIQLTVARFGKPGGALELEVRRGREVLASGHLDRGWREGAVQVPIAPTPRHDVGDVEVCVRSPAARGRLTFAGEATLRRFAATSRDRRLGGRVALVSYGRPGSLLSYGDRIVARYGHGAARWLGGWTLWLIAALAVAGLVAAGVALVRPRARYAVAAVLVLGTGWALLTPAFMVPDETAHYAYVETLVETGRLPLDDPRIGEGSPKLRAVLDGLSFGSNIGDQTSKPPWTSSEEAALRAAERRRLSRTSRDASTASANPPLYYLAQAPVYAAFRGTSPLTALLPMRLLSVALSGLTVFFVFAFLRELVPRHPIAWSAGALAAALQPLFEFIGSGVNADAALFAACAAVFWAMAVVLRRGLTMRRAVLLGAALAAGLLIKPLFVGVMPAGVAALGLAALRTAAPWRRRAALLSTGLAVAFVPVLLYAVIGSVAFDHGLLPGAVDSVTGPSATMAANGVPVGLHGELSYLWQVFLPRLPFQNDLLPGIPLRDIWFDGFVGRFGWLDYAFPRTATDQALWVGWAVLALAGVALVRFRRALGGRWPLALCFLIAIAGVLAAIAVEQYRAALSGGNQFTQARYLLPLLALYAGLGAVATIALGRKAAFFVALVLVGLAAYHDLSSMLLTVQRFYA